MKWTLGAVAALVLALAGCGGGAQLFDGASTRAAAERDLHAATITNVDPQEWNIGSPGSRFHFVLHNRGLLDNSGEVWMFRSQGDAANAAGTSVVLARQLGVSHPNLIVDQNALISFDGAPTDLERNTVEGWLQSG
jgi:hypothetical protein